MSSDDEGSDVIRGLKEMGLYTDDVPEKPKTEEKKKKKSSPAKRRPRKRQPLNLDALMDGIDVPAPSPTDDVLDAKPLPLATNFEQYITYGSSIASVERSVSDYLDRSIRTMLDEFSVELNDMLVSENDYEAKAEEFIDGLKGMIRDELVLARNDGFEQQMSNVVAGFDLLGPRFLELFREVEDMQNVSIPQRLKEARKANASITSYRNSMKRQFIYDELLTELKDLNELRRKELVAKKSQMKRERNRFLAVVELEAQQHRQKLEAENIARKMERVHENERRLEELEFSDRSESRSDLGSQMRSVIYSLTSYATQRPGKTMSWQYRSLSDALEKAVSIRNAYDYNVNMLIANLERAPLQPSMISMTNISVKERPEKPKAVDASQNEGLLTRVRNKLERLQQKREDSLETTAKFISQVRRKERRRAEKHASRFMNPDMDMDTLFSFV